VENARFGFSVKPKSLWCLFKQNMLRNFEQLVGMSKDRYMYIAVTLQVWCVEKESDSDEAKILADVCL